MNASFPEVVFVARIGPSITAIIQVADTMKQTITGLISPSQFQSPHFSTLTHAWLKL